MDIPHYTNEEFKVLCFLSLFLFDPKLKLCSAFVAFPLVLCLANFLSSSFTLKISQRVGLEQKLII